VPGRGCINFQFIMKMFILLVILAATARAVDEYDQQLLKWGGRGHASIGAIASTLLSVKANQTISEILDFTTPPGNLEQIASWADEVKHTEAYEWSAPLHYTNVPTHACDFDYKRDCADDICVNGAINNYTAQLGPNASKTGFNQTEALMFLVHFIGDIHQPLHVGQTADRGGNNIEITFNSYPDNLHAIWDVWMIVQRLKDLFGPGGTDTYHVKEWAGMLEEDIRSTWSQNVPQWEDCSATEMIGMPSDYSCPDVWSTESSGDACTYAYQQNNQWIQSGDDIETPYYEKAWPLIEMRLAQAAVRLANVLNNIFD